MKSSDFLHLCGRVVHLPDARRESLLYSLIGGMAATEEGAALVEWAVANEEAAVATTAQQPKEAK